MSDGLNVPLTSLSRIVRCQSPRTHQVSRDKFWLPPTNPVVSKTFSSNELSGVVCLELLMCWEFKMSCCFFRMANILGNNTKTTSARESLPLCCWSIFSLEENAHVHIVACRLVGDVQMKLNKKIHFSFVMMLEEAWPKDKLYSACFSVKHQVFKINFAQWLQYNWRW